MSFTSEVKDELSRVEPTCSRCDKAELFALIRIEGTLSIVTYINNPASPYDTVRLTCWLVDRALHHSDTITTPEIIVRK